MFDASMKFDLGEDVNALRDMVHRWAQERVKPMAAEIDSSNEFPADLWTEMGELGLLGMTVDEEFGGTGMGYVAHVIAVEELARASASVSLSYGAHSNLCVNQISPGSPLPGPRRCRDPGCLRQDRPGRGLQRHYRLPDRTVDDRLFDEPALRQAGDAWIEHGRIDIRRRAGAL